jgi:hypothetical protein
MCPRYHTGQETDFSGVQLKAHPGMADREDLGSLQMAWQRDQQGCRLSTRQI